MTDVYVHVPQCFGTPLTYPIRTSKEECASLTFGAVKQALTKEFLARNGPYSLPEQTQFYNEWKHPMKDTSLLVNAVGTDFFLKQVKDKKEFPDNIHPDLKLHEVTTTAEKPRAAASTGAPKPKYNSKQSPFGTDIQKYESITEYTWEDSTMQVKVLVFFKDIGNLPKENIVCHFGKRQFEVLINNYGPEKKNYRLGCNKTHGFLDFENCTWNVRQNRINVILRKEGDGDSWYELFKVRAVGEKPYEDE